MFITASIGRYQASKARCGVEGLTSPLYSPLLDSFDVSSPVVPSEDPTGRRRVVYRMMGEVLWTLELAALK